MRAALGALAAFLAAAALLCAVVDIWEPSGGPLIALAIPIDALPATAMWLVGIRWPIVREGGDVGVFTAFGGLAFYGGLAGLAWRARSRSGARQPDPGPSTDT